jgi:glycosyltransferase involved in cell wall biosynthesis
MKPLRVLQVVVNMNAGGIENLLMNLYRKIDRDKIQFDFLFHTSEKCFFEEEIVRLGGCIYRVIPLKVNNLINYNNALNLFFKTHSYKIVHSHISVWSFFILNVAKKNNVQVRIAHSHEAHESIWDHSLYRVPLIYTLKKIINNPVTHRFACGRDAGKWLFGEISNFTVINNSIDVDQFVYNPHHSLIIKKELSVENSLVFGHVGRFNKQKNHHFLIEIFEGIAKKYDSAKLILVGEGNLQSEIKQLVKDKKLEDKVIFLGLREDINKILQAFDYFLMPSFYEGLPVSLIEAQASGLKIFASDKIAKETNLTNNIDYLDILNVHTWTSHIELNLKYDRADTKKILIKAGYDALENANKLTAFYFKQVII